MNTYEIIKDLAKQKKLSIRQLEMNFGYSNGYIGSWKRQTPNSTELARLADYFNVSVDYLLGRTENPNTQKQQYTETDLEKMLDNAMSYSGKPMSEHDREVIKAFLKGKYGI